MIFGMICPYGKYIVFCFVSHLIPFLRSLYSMLALRFIFFLHICFYVLLKVTPAGKFYVTKKFVVKTGVTVFYLPLLDKNTPVGGISNFD